MDAEMLRTQHAEMLEMASRIAGAISQPQQPPGIGQMRWQFARMVMTHLALEDRFVYPALQRSTDPAKRAYAIQLQKDVGQLAEVFSRYVSAWSEDRIARDWPGFCVATRAILGAIDHRIALEDRFYTPMMPELGKLMRA